MIIINIMFMLFRADLPDTDLRDGTSLVDRSGISRLVIRRVKMEDKGVYRCIIRVKNGTKSKRYGGPYCGMCGGTKIGGGSGHVQPCRLYCTFHKVQLNTKNALMFILITNCRCYLDPPSERDFLEVNMERSFGRSKRKSSSLGWWVRTTKSETPPPSRCGTTTTFCLGNFCFLLVP